jgi:hypothetical protein
MNLLPKHKQQRDDSAQPQKKKFRSWFLESGKADIPWCDFQQQQRPANKAQSEGTQCEIFHQAHCNHIFKCLIADENSSLKGKQ